VLLLAASPNAIAVSPGRAAVLGESLRRGKGLAAREHYSGKNMSREIGTLYRASGVIETVQPHDGRKFTLKELQGFVGGYIELVPYTRPFAYCNDEGLLDDLPVNSKASEFFNWPGLRGDVIQVRRVK
jgi:Domain of unknown function (DUF3846)